MVGRKISWQPKPIRQIRALERYWREEQGTTQTFDYFLMKLYQKLERIAEYPEIGHLTRYDNVRYVRIDRHRSIFYRIRKDRLQILLLWDGRQEPSKNPYKR
jgi:plasmid stabilization system protein ParE